MVATGNAAGIVYDGIPWSGWVACHPTEEPQQSFFRKPHIPALPWCRDVCVFAGCLSRCSDVGGPSATNDRRHSRRLTTGYRGVPAACSGRSRYLSQSCQDASTIRWTMKPQAPAS
jgi:hypothetical protein